METRLYMHRRNHNKYLEVRRYKDGHYVWKQFTTYFIPELGKNYTGTTLKRSHVGTWHRVSKFRTLSEVLESYTETITYGYEFSADGIY